MVWPVFVNERRERKRVSRENERREKGEREAAQKEILEVDNAIQTDSTCARSKEVHTSTVVKETYVLIIAAKPNNSLGER